MTLLPILRTVTIRNILVYIVSKEMINHRIRTNHYLLITESAEEGCVTSSLAAFKSGSHLNMITDYVWDQIAASYTHLIFSVNFDIYTRDRPGFQKLYRGLSDKAWDRALHLIKYYTVRGGKPVLDIANNLTNINGDYPTSVEEVRSLKEAVRLEKDLSAKAYKIHAHFSSHKGSDIKDLDAGIAHYVEEKFIEDQADTIRHLTGYYNDLSTLLGNEKCTKSKNGALACYLFDEYLQKQ